MHSSESNCKIRISEALSFTLQNFRRNTEKEVISETYYITQLYVPSDTSSMSYIFASYYLLDQWSPCLSLTRSYHLKIDAN